MANPNCADCERLMTDSASPSEEVWCQACQPVETDYSEEAALLDRLEALDTETAPGPWKWVKLHDGTVGLVQDRNPWPGGWAEVLTVDLADRLDQAQKAIKALGDRLSEARKTADALKAEVVEMKRHRDFPEKQAATCADCGVYKHTPWRGAQGYICAGCLAKERDQAREMAVWAYCQGEKWVALAPQGLVLGSGRWCPAEGDEADEFNTEEEALSAGRGAEVGWWEEISQ